MEGEEKLGKVVHCVSESCRTWREYDKVLKDFIDQKRDEKLYKKVWFDISVYNTINREEIRRSRRWYTIQESRIVGQRVKNCRSFTQ